MPFLKDRRENGRLDDPLSAPDVSLIRTERTLVVTEKKAMRRKCVQSETGEKCSGASCPAWRRIDDNKGFCTFWRRRIL